MTAIVDKDTNIRGVWVADSATGLPLFVSDATAANQTTQITAANLTNTRLNTIQGLTGSGNRAFVVKGSIPNGQTSYSGTGGIVMGGLITVATGLPAGTIITAGQLMIKGTFANLTTNTGSVMAPVFFDANPTGSTITDNTGISIVSADVPKAISYTTIAWTGATTGSVPNATATLRRMAVDGSGNIYFALVAVAANTFAGANVLFYELDGVY